MINGKTNRWDIPTSATNEVYALRWTTTICRECRSEYLRYWERRNDGSPDGLIVGVECFHLTEDQWPPDFRRRPTR